MLKGSVATFAREKWKKGDTVIIKLKSLKGNKKDLEVGILPAEDINAGWGYNDYGVFIKKMAEKPEDEVEFTIPGDGEYGIYVKDKTSNTISFQEIIVEKEIVSTESEKKPKKEYSFELKNHNSVEFEIEVNKKFINPLTEIEALE